MIILVNTKAFRKPAQAKTVITKNDKFNLKH